MNPVRLIQLGMPGNSLEQKRDKSEIFGSRNVDICLPEAPGVRRAKIWRSFHHSQENSRPGRDRSNSIHDRPEIRLERIGIERPQSVVAARLDDADVRRLLETPIE